MFSTEIKTNSRLLDDTINYYFDYVNTVAINNSQWNFDDDINTVQNRSFEVIILLGKVPNSIAFVNFYSFGRIDYTFEVMENIRKNVSLLLDDPTLSPVQLELIRKLNVIYFEIKTRTNIEKSIFRIQKS